MTTKRKATERALYALFAARRMAACELGTKLWPKRTGPVISHNGGGDYAAQMLLGRMKKAGLVQHAPSEGSSVWELTPVGIARHGGSREAVLEEDLTRNPPANRRGQRKP